MRSLHTQLLRLIILLIVLPTGILGAVGYFTAKGEASRAVQDFLEQRDNDISTIAENPALLNYAINAYYGLQEEAAIARHEVDNSLHRFLERSNASELTYRRVTFVSEQGEVAASSRAQTVHGELSASLLESARKAIADSKPVHSAVGPEMFTVLPVIETAPNAEPRARGALVFEFNLPLERLEHTTNVIARTFLVVMGVSILIALAAALYQIRRITRPLRALSEAAKTVAAEQGDVKQDLDTDGRLENAFVRSRDHASSEEIQSLSGALADLLRRVKLRDQELRASMADLARALELSREAEKVKSEFLANVSHELRTPLNAIVNVPKLLLEEMGEEQVWRCGSCKSEFLKQAEPGEASGEPEETTAECPTCGGVLSMEKRIVNRGVMEDQLKLLRRLEHSGKYLLTIVGDILDFSKLDAGRQKLHYEAVNVDALIEDVLRTVGVLADREGVQLRVERAPDAEWVEGDSVRLSQVLMNLVGNAVKFTPRGGQITVRARRDESRPVPSLLFEVEDTGIGIPADQLGFVFDSFRQVDGSHTRKKGGTGLGLAIAKGLVELHGGTISVRSQLEKGTTFFFFVPVKKSAAPAPLIPPELSASNGAPLKPQSSSST